MLKQTTVSEALKLENRTIIESLTGILEAAYEPKPAGKAHLQVIELGDIRNRRDRVTVKLWNQEIDINPKDKGRVIIIDCVDGQDGPHGVEVAIESFFSKKENREKESFVISVNRANISFVAATPRDDEAPPPAKEAKGEAPPEGEMTRERKIAALHADYEEARKDLMKPLNNILLGFDGAIYIRDHIKARHGIELSTENLIAMLGQIGITGDKYGAFDKVPKCNLTKVMRELNLLPSDEPKK